jgi:hypothetical protein
VTATLNGQPIEFAYTEMQESVFLHSTAKIVVCSAGRRCGKSAGAAQYLVELLLSADEPTNFLWLDLQYSQIQNYYERYFRPHLLKLDQSIWSWNQQKKELTVLGSKLSMRSIDREDLLVGLSYQTIVVNEAGIALHDNPTLLSQIVLPMMLDYPNSRIFLIGTPRGTIGKDGKDAVFFLYFKRGMEGDPKVQSFEFTSYDNPFLREEDIKELEDEVAPQLRLQELYAKFLNVADIQIFNPEWWKISEELPPPHVIESSFISIDTAFSTKTTADESAMSVWNKTFQGQYYCVDIFHDRLDYPSLVRAVKRMVEKHHPSYLLIEAKASGQSLIQTLKTDIPEIPIRSFEPNKDKITELRGR